MDIIKLSPRDRKNLYVEDAQNVFAVTATPDEADDMTDVAQSFDEAVEHLHRTGQRFAYVVIKIEV